jgi:predicted nucleic acid-binding Zn ribbon protein
MNRPPSDPLSEQLAAERLAELDQRRATQQRRFYARRPKRIANVVAQLVQRKGYAQIRAAGEREEAWREALQQQGGEHWTAATRVAGVRRGVFEVQVANSLLMQELTFQKEPLLKRLQDALPEDGIKQIKFSVGQIS